MRDVSLSTEGVWIVQRVPAAHGKRTALEPWHADILAADPVGG